MGQAELHPPEVPAPRATWRDVLQLYRHHRGRMTAGLLLMLLSRIVGFALPASSKFAVDDIIGQHRVVLLLPLTAAVVVATVVQAVAAFAQLYLMGISAERAIVRTRCALQAKVLSLPIPYFDATKAGVLVARIMEDTAGLGMLVGIGFLDLVGGLMTAAIGLGALVWLNWRLTIIIGLCLVMFGALLSHTLEKLRSARRDYCQKRADLTGRLTETLTGIRVVKVCVAERQERQVFLKGSNRLLREFAGILRGAAGMDFVATFLFGAVGALTLILGVHAVLHGSMTMGDLVMYVFVVGLVASPLIGITSITIGMSEALAGLDRVREIMATEGDERDPVHSVAAPRILGDVVFEDVSFAYIPGIDVLRHVSFRTLPGSTTALVGPSGSGKSTLIGLIMTFYRPAAGRILVDGRNLAILLKQTYLTQLGVVLQDNFLFDGTVAENIRLARPGASLEEVRAAGRTAHCQEFVEQLPHAYDTVIGERGVKLSGGQRQRIAIARAILADPRILILDEATSSLDSESETHIRAGLQNLRAGRTTFVIAHRLSTVQSADQILVLQHGEIAERGTHAELMERSGCYRNMYSRQADVVSDDRVGRTAGSDP